MDAPPTAGLLGRLALHFHLVTMEQLNEAVAVQGRPGNTKRLGEILVELGHLAPERLNWLLHVQSEVAARRIARLEEERRASVIEYQEATRGGTSLVPPPPEEAAPSVSRPPDDSPLPPPPGMGVTEAAMPAAPEPRAVSVAPEPRAVSVAPEPARYSRLPRRATGRLGQLTLDRILAHAVKLRASDVHLHSGAPVQMRVHGKLLAAPTAPVTGPEVEALLADLLDPDELEHFRAHREIDFAVSLQDVGRFRVNAYRQQRGTDAVFRPIPARPPTLEQLGLPATLARLTSYHQGLVLVTGPAGCGKSSTLASFIDIINEERRDHIITVEDPIEFLHPSKRCVVNQRQAARHTESFATALRAALREDPDVIAIGELRDLETVSLAITAAETGHLVLATLHTSSAVRTINRVLDVFPPKQQAQIRAMVSESLRAVISQRLVPTADGAGRVPALEILMVTPAVSNLIREEKTFQVRSVLQTGRAQGMCLLDDSLAELCKGGLVDRGTARRFAEDPRLFA